MGIFINGVDVSESPFGIVNTYALQLTDIFRKMDEPVDMADSGSNRKKATDADFKVWSITGGLPVVSGGEDMNRSDDKEIDVNGNLD